MAALVRVQDLKVVATDSRGAETCIVDGVSFAVARGEVLALIGASGSGKTTTALALMGYARSGCRISHGSIQLGDTDIRALSAAQLQQLRGNQVAYIAQSAAAAFNPARSIMAQVIESALMHGLLTHDSAERRARELFRSLALPDPDHIGARYPHQVSGGQLQRLMAAMALMTRPSLVILDEPTTALDVTTQIEVLRAFKHAIREHGASAVYVSHDLAVVAQMADQIVVLERGVVAESGTTHQVLTAATASHTLALLDAAQPRVDSSLRAGNSPPAAAVPAPLLEIKDLSAGYGRSGAGIQPRHLALKAFDLTLRRGAMLGVIGESGSGKSTLARVIAGILPPASGSIQFDGATLPTSLALRTADQFRRIQIVFQNADTALNPAHSVAQVLGRPLALYQQLRGAAAAPRIARLLDLVKLPANIATRRCTELSGGQKQRINLARALAAEPDLILCDEVTSALDTVAGAAILQLIAELRRELQLTCLFISHDVNTVRAVCDEVVVLYAGRKLESAGSRSLLDAPHHPYTELLIASVPRLSQGWLDQLPPPPTLPELGNSAAAGGTAQALCAFLARCPVRMAGVCDQRAPAIFGAAGSREILCHRSGSELGAGMGVRPA
jgi:peptide/nickel transport system ATP-binding protein